MRIGFVILCYQNYKVVQTCVESLLGLNGIDDCIITIVDNGSSNNAVEFLRDNFKESNIFIIQNANNEGYAKGNNIGYSFLKEKGCDSIIIINSDAYIQTPVFLDILKNKYDGTNIHLVAPDIYNPIGSHVNPGSKSNYSKSFFCKSIVKNRLYILLLYLGIDYRTIKNKDNIVYDNRKTNDSNNYFIPHGSCLIFLDNWVKNEDKAFCDKTFLFFEERFLIAYMEKKGYKLCFENSLKVLHDEDGSIKALNPTLKKKRIFVLKNQNKSLKTFLKYMKDPIKEW